MPPAFKYIESKQFVVFDYKKYDQDLGVWFINNDSSMYLFNDQSFEPLTCDTMELTYMNRMRVPFFVNHGISFHVNGGALEASYYDQNNNNKIMSAGKAIKNLPWLVKKTDADIEKLVNQVKAKLDPTIKFSIVSGVDILYWYHGQNYAENSGSLSSSCMRYGRCQDYLRIYSDNPVEMLIATDEQNKLRGRALLWPRSMWNKNYWDNVDYIMDRIYGKDHIIEKFKQYAQNKQWVYKNRQTYQEVDTWRVPGDYELCVKRCRMNLDNINFDEYPYMDTFNRIDWNDKCLKNHGTGSILDSTEGYSRETESCNSCGGECNEDNSSWVDDDRYCEECAVYSEYSDCDLLRDECRYSEVLVSYIHDDNAVEITHGSYRNDFTHYDEIVEVYNDNTIVVPECDVTTSHAPVPFICGDDILRVDFINNQDTNYLIASLSEMYNERCWEEFMLDVYSNIRSTLDATDIDARVVSVVIKTVGEHVEVPINNNWSVNLHETMCAIAEHYPANFESLTI